MDVAVDDIDRAPRTDDLTMTIWAIWAEIRNG